MNQKYFFVKDIRVSGNEVLYTDDVKEEINHYLDQRVLFIFPRKNTFFVNAGKLEEFLYEKFSRIHEIQISLVERGDVIQVEIEERKAHSLWCNNREYEHYTDEECYYADQNAYIYTESPYFSPKVFIKSFLPPGDIIKKKEILPADEFEDFFLFLDRLEEMFAFRVHHVEKDIHGDIRVFLWSIEDVVYQDNFPMLVYNEEMSYELVLEHTQLTLDHQSFKKDFKNQSQALKKIDVRFEDRIFFTFQ